MQAYEKHNMNYKRFKITHRVAVANIIARDQLQTLQFIRMKGFYAGAKL
jgi:hypothetical protein